MPLTQSLPTEAAGLVEALATPATIANPYPLYQRLRPLTPVYGYRDYPPGTIPDADEAVTAWVLMRYEQVAAAARDHDSFSSRDPLQENSSAPTLMLVNHDNPEHDRLRAIVNLVFSRRGITGLEAWAAALAAELVATMDNGDEVVGKLTAVIPARVMLRFLGLPDADAARFRRWATAFMLSAPLSPAEREASNGELFEYFVARVSEAAQEAHADGAPQDLISALLTAEVDGARLSFDEVVRFCITLVVAGSETTTFLLTNLLYNLASMPALYARLRADRGLVRAFIDESLRHGGPPQRLFRIATRDVDIDGRRIRAGDWVALFFAAANHDPDVFPEPARFDIDRPNLARHMTFGHGVHHCLGSALARLEASSLVNAVLDHCPALALSARPPEPQTASLLTCSYQALYIDFQPAGDRP